MASLAVMSTVSGIVAANWTYTPIYDLNDLAAPPSDGSAFLDIEYPIRDERQESFGAPTNYHREEGAFVVVLSVPIGQGINETAAPWMTRLEALMQAFRGKFINSTEFLGFTGPTFNDSSDDGAYFEISFSCSYRYLFVA